MGSEQSVEENFGPEGKINVIIQAGDGSGECVVDLEGEIRQVVADADIANFGFSEDRLKKIIAPMDFQARTPHYVDFKSPTRAKETFYTDLKAEQVTKIMKPVNSTIIGKETKTVALGNRTLQNRSQVRGTYKCDMSYTEENTVSTTWSRNESVAVEHTVEHKILIPGSAALTFSSSYGEECVKSSTVTIGSESGVSVELDPGQEVVATIILNKHVYQIEIEYEVSLTGQVLAIYEYITPFWPINRSAVPYNITTLMNLAGLSNSKTFKEVIKIDYFTGGRVVLTDNSN